MSNLKMIGAAFGVALAGALALTGCIEQTSASSHDSQQQEAEVAQTVRTPGEWEMSEIVVELADGSQVTCLRSPAPYDTYVVTCDWEHKVLPENEEVEADQ